MQIHIAVFYGLLNTICASPWSFRKALVKLEKEMSLAKGRNAKELGKLLIWTWRCSVKAQCKQ